ncbi:hypothetical protein SME10J_36580 [Serratia marcescens]|nr:hypothetical protein SME10J_36580 [Serratia marcescens]
MPNKTKAALPGRQCQSTKLKPIQNSTLVGLVNMTEGGIPPSPNYRTVLATAEVISTNLQSPKGVYPEFETPYQFEVYGSFRRLRLGRWVLLYVLERYQPFLHPFSMSSGLTEQSGFKRKSNIPVWYKNQTITNAITIRPGVLFNSDFIEVSPLKDQPFGSMPRCCSSLRIMRLIQAASDSSPSCRCASSIESRSSGSNRNWNGGFPRLSFLCVDTFSTPDVMCLCVITHYMHMNEKATPRSAVTLPRRLTKPLYEVTIMADMQSTQTRSKFTFLFLATPDHTPECAPVVLRFDADTEAAARDAFPGWDLIFAAKIRTQPPCRVAFFDYATRSGWEFDSASVQEVRHGV